jgi:hypothetical protein
MANSSIPYGEIVKKILTRFPIRNPQWTHSEKTDHFIADVSAIEHDGYRDPWNRPLPPRSGWHPERDREGEITGWVLMTTVDSRHLSLTIIND